MLNLPCMALYWRGVMCSKPGGGLSQYKEGFLRRLLRVVRSRERDRERDFFSPLERERDLEKMSAGSKDMHDNICIAQSHILIIIFHTPYNWNVCTYIRRIDRF